MSNTKFQYLHDPKMDKRITTVAFRVEEKYIVYGFATCKPHYMRKFTAPIPGPRGELQTAEVFVPHEGDDFNRARGREIAEGRLEVLAYHIKVREDEPPRVTLMKHLASAVPHKGKLAFIPRSAQAWLDAVETRLIHKPKRPSARARITA